MVGRADPSGGASSNGAAAGAPPSVAFSLQLPHEAGSITSARHAARQRLAAIDVSAGVLDDIELALSEACTNVLNHAGSGEGYDVAVLVRDDRCEMTVTDRGLGFDLESVRPLRSDGQAEGGRGLAIMVAVMDRVELESEAGRGTLVTLVKQLTFDRGHREGAVGGVGGVGGVGAVGAVGGVGAVGAVGAMTAALPEPAAADGLGPTPMVPAAEGSGA
jgi:serine/threonine-protein kinase RsbW